MNKNQTYTGIIVATMLSGCCVYKEEYSSRKIIQGEVVWKARINKNKEYNSDHPYNLKINIDLGEKTAIFYKQDKNLHEKTNSKSLVNIVCREVYDCKYRKDKLVSKSLSKLKIYHVCTGKNCSKDTLYVARRKIN